MKKSYLFVFLFIFLIIIFNAIFLINNDDKSPEKVIGKLYKAIELAKEKGDYNCCIEPACTMCYFGKWKFEKGTCHCDEAIAEGRFDDVCPECKSGIEKGLCDSTKEDCILDEGIYG